MSAMPTGRSVRRPLEPFKFRAPEVTATGAERAFVELSRLETLWFNTGTLCNVECLRCYIDSSPTNDRLAYLTCGEVERYLDELAALDSGTREIGFTGGEPFMNPAFPAMLEECLARGFDVLVLTNAMQPMMRPAVRSGLLRLREAHGDRLHLRVSLDHYTPELHEKERGARSWAAALRGLRWLADNGLRWSVAGRTCWREPEGELRDGYARLFAVEGLALDAHDPAALVLFPEMDAALDVPEITVDCWQILGVEPSAVMCATSRMVVKRRGATAPTVVTCTLLPYDPRFELGPALRDALGPVRLNHPHCARFCVLGGASCSVVA
ncbi:MAG: radical SAM protein [Acidobacteriota bacterium]|nr:radical SAM protein [Acidobacteriota bacterium]MDH3525163.1 radical SAM protein [Acidobacteriota bacterium]